jgi:chorismate synthase
VKPTPSIFTEQDSVDREGNAVKIKIRGRHDPCLVPRIIPVVEAMAALTAADLFLRSRTCRMDQLG